jgi:hypothetical protein
MKWIKGEPPKDGKNYLMKFSTGMYVRGRYRIGRSREPQPDIIAWRCNCCGRYGDPVEWYKGGRDEEIRAAKG